MNSWQDLADSYLCSENKGHAADIGSALNQYYPGMFWYVMVQDYRNGWAVSHRGEFHQADNLCKKNMFVWRTPYNGKSCSRAAASASQTLLDIATNNYATAAGVRDSFVNGLLSS